MTQGTSKLAGREHASIATHRSSIVCSQRTLASRKCAAANSIDDNRGIKAKIREVAPHSPTALVRLSQVNDVSDEIHSQPPTQDVESSFMQRMQNRFIVTNSRSRDAARRTALSILMLAPSLWHHDFAQPRRRHDDRAKTR